MTITCPACHAVHVQGTLFCEHCGASLIGMLPTDDAQAAATPFLAVPASGPDNGAATAGGTQEIGADNPSTLPLNPVRDRDFGSLVPGAVPSRMRVLVLNTGRLTEWLDDATIHVGRGDRTADVNPTIDLETDGGHNAGVSRRHVRILRQPDGFYLEDLGSINGTFLNRRRLSPGTPTELKDGDEIRLGNIVLRIVLGGYPSIS